MTQFLFLVNTKNKMLKYLFDTKSLSYNISIKSHERLNSLLLQIIKLRHTVLSYRFYWINKKNALKSTKYMLMTCVTICDVTQFSAYHDLMHN